MADPLSITVGVVGLLSACMKVGADLKDIYDGAAIADPAVTSLGLEVEGFAHTLQLMNDTLETPNVKISIQATGHIGNHWNYISKSIKDGQDTVAKLQVTLQKVDKSVSVLDSTRKHFRLKAAAGEIAMYQRQVSFYKDTMQASLQTMIL